MCFNSSTWLYSCQLDKQWFNLHNDILKDALNITPANDNNPFVAPPSSDTVIEYVNTLGYPSTLKNVSAMSVNALYQPWRAILSMINMCLTGKTTGFDRPRHPVLQILWGIIHSSNIDYAERIWEEFVQSIQTFLTDRKNLATAARGKKKTAHLLIPSVRFTKLIIHHLRTKHNIHPRTGSPLHYSHEESILNTLRFVGKDGREIFGMPIPDALLTDEIKGAPYYGDYQEHVAKYQQFLDEERGKAEKGGATESSEATKVTKPKAAKATKPAGDKAPKPTATQPPKPKPAPTQPSKAVSEKKHKLVKETPDEPSPAKRSKVENLPTMRKDANLQRALELESMEQEVQGKGKEKVVEEQAAHDLLTLQTPQKKSLADQFIFQKRPPMPTESSTHAESPSMDAELNLTDSEIESDEEASKINVEIKKERLDQTLVYKMKARLDQTLVNKIKARLDQTLKLEQMDEEFTTTAYPNVQENLKLPTKDQFFVEKPHEEESRKTNAKTEVQSMVSVPIHQDTSSVPPMTTPVGQAWDPTIQLGESQYSLQGEPSSDEIVTDVVDWAMQAPLRARFKDLPTVDMKEILQQRMRKLVKRDERDVTFQELLLGLHLHRHHHHLLQQAQSKCSRNFRASWSFSVRATPPPLSIGLSNKATTSDTRYESTGFTAIQETSPSYDLMHDDSILDEHAHLSDDEDSENDHLPKDNMRKDWWKPLPEEERPATPKPA
ncbi:hypothetical protein Tco_0632309 [Tanacetum coccineum]